MAKCAICGKETEQAVPVVLPLSGGLIQVCRHGHFEGTHVNPLTGFPESMTGPHGLGLLVGPIQDFNLEPMGWIRELAKGHEIMEGVTGG